MFIKKLDLAVDLEQVKKDANEIINQVGWGDFNQISLVHRPSTLNQSERWRDGIGSLFADGKRLFHERDFVIVNNQVPIYIKKILNDLAASQNIKIGRVRLMNLPYNQGLGVHYDESVRYHLAITTHNRAYIGESNLTEPSAVCYHIPANGHFYQVDTTKPHFVFNAANIPRIHLVICPIN